MKVPPPILYVKRILDDLPCFGSMGMKHDGEHGTLRQVRTRGYGGDAGKCCRDAEMVELRH
jgi:hypothetical protein